MTQPASNFFLIGAYDPELCCSVLEIRVEVPDLSVLRAALGIKPEEDSDFRRNYILEGDEPARVFAAVGTGFDLTLIEDRNWQIWMCRLHSIRSAPYLIHTGFELFLMLDGRKKLARMSDSYPPMQFDGEDRFDDWVARGVLHKEEVVEPFDNPRKKWDGVRTVYYTLKGEEWRIPAMKLIWGAFGKSGGWNEYYERLEGMLFGYEGWQNDWWIEQGITRGGFGGLRLCCAVDAAGLAWIESAGFRALPPAGLSLMGYDVEDESAMRAFMCETPDSVALVSINVFARAVEKVVDFSGSAPRFVPGDRVRELNQSLRRPVTVVMRREGDGRVR